jgi:hypothetical protein
LVIEGDHMMAAEACPGHAMLSVWPPDGDAVQAWIKAWRGGHIVIVCIPARVDLGQAVDGFTATAWVRLPPGRKGGNFMRVWSI